MTNKVQKPTGEAVVLAEFKPTKQNILITFKEGTDAFGNDGEYKFYNDTTEFRDIKGYSLHGPYLIVQLKDDTQYVYNMEDIKSLYLTVDKE